MTAVPTTQPSGRRRARLDIPKIRLLSWLGLESVIWGVVIAHLVKWAGNTAYFVTFQPYWGYQYPKGRWHTYWGLKGAWDDLPHWLGLTAGHPAWWDTVRHDIRDVGIALLATILVQFLFTKPKYSPEDQPGVRRYVTSVPLAILAAGVPIALIAVLAWKLPWLTHHGLHVPDRYGSLAAEANGWIEAGTWITVLMGIAGGIAARPFVKRIADDVQWFVAERSAGRIRSESPVSLTGHHVWGTPVHRARVHWLLDRRPELPARNPWLVRALLITGFLFLVAAGVGAWLTIAGPAAPH